MPAILPLVAMLAFVTTPAIAPPSPEQIAAASELWRIRPLARYDRNQAFDIVTVQLANDFLMRARASRSPDNANVALLLSRRLRDRVAAVRESLDEGTIRCLATDLAYRLSVDQLNDVRRFIATPSGRAFWDYYSRWGIAECWRAQLEPVLEPFLEADVREARRAAANLH